MSKLKGIKRQQIATHNQSFAKILIFFARKVYWSTNKIDTKNVTNISLLAFYYWKQKIIINF